MYIPGANWSCAPCHQIFMGISHTVWNVLRKGNWSHNPVQANKDKLTHQNNNSSLQTKSTHCSKRLSHLSDPGCRVKLN